MTTREFHTSTCPATPDVWRYAVRRPELHRCRRIAAPFPGVLLVGQAATDWPSTVITVRSG